MLVTCEHNEFILGMGFPLVLAHTLERPDEHLGRHRFSSVAAVQSCFCFIIVAAAIVLGIGALFLLFVLLYSQRVASQSCETLGELLHHPIGLNHDGTRNFVFLSRSRKVEIELLPHAQRTNTKLSEDSCHHSLLYKRIPCLRTNF